MVKIKKNLLLLFVSTLFKINYSSTHKINFMGVQFRSCIGLMAEALLSTSDYMTVSYYLITYNSSFILDLKFTLNNYQYHKSYAWAFIM